MKPNSFRRSLLDDRLSKITFSGKILDVGGKKENKRGNFRPPSDGVVCWHYLNLDKCSKPDYCCDAENIPVESCMYDMVLMCEVLEHLRNPEKVVREALRVLNVGGQIVLSVPFLFPVHADPYDFQRWTDAKFRAILADMGFLDVEIAPMGGLGSVIHDLLYVAFNHIQNRVGRGVGHLMLRYSRWFFHLVDVVFSSSGSLITTGYFLTARKNDTP